MLMDPGLEVDNEEYLRGGAEEGFENSERKLVNFCFPDKNEASGEKEVKFEVFPEDQGRRQSYFSKNNDEGSRKLKDGNITCKLPLY